jgi:DNA polymerase sigma
MTSEQDWEDEDFIGLDEFVISRDTRSEAHDGHESKADDVKDKLTVSQMENFSTQRSFQKQESSSSELVSNLGRRDHWPPWKNLSGPTTTGSYHHYHREPPGLVKLHNEIVDFVTLMEPWPEEIEERETIIREVTDLVQKTFGGSDRVSDCKMKICLNFKTSSTDHCQLTE